MITSEEVLETPKKNKNEEEEKEKENDTEKKENNEEKGENEEHLVTVDEQIKDERVQRLIALSDQLAKEYASNFEGEVLEVIPEEPYKKDPNSN